MRHRNARPIGTSPRTRLVHAGAAIVAIGLTAALVSACGATDDSATAGSSGASRWTQPRTAWGEPDLQGVWRYEGAIPFNGPEFEGRELLTDEEVAQRDRGERAGRESACGARRRRSGPPFHQRIADSGQRVYSFWQDHGRPRKVYKQTSLIVEPRDGACRIRQTRGRRRRERPPAWRDRSNRFSIRIRANGVDRRRHGNDVGTQRRLQSDRAEPGYVTILHEECGIAASSRPTGVHTATSGNGSAIPLAVGRPTRSSSIPSTFSTGRTTNGPASGRAHPRRCISSNGSRGSMQKRSIQDHRRGSGDVLLALDAVIPISRPRRTIRASTNTRVMRGITRCRICSAPAAPSRRNTIIELR